MSIADYFRSYRRVPLVETLAQSVWPRVACLSALHLAGLFALYRTEYGVVHLSLALLTWGLLNFFWLAVLRRPVMAAAISLVIVEILIRVSTLKFHVTWMTVTFLDVLIIDPDTFSFLLGVIPALRLKVMIGALIMLPLGYLLWRLDPFRWRRSVAAAAAAICLAGIAIVSNLSPEKSAEPFQGVNHVSNFVRSGVVAGAELFSHGWLEAGPATAEVLKTSIADDTCTTTRRPPHIILVLDESSFDIRMAPGVNVPENYADHFASSDGKIRRLITEASGGPTWYTEYNVLTGLSARSYGRMMFHLTRIAAGRVERGLPQSLRRCGYKTFTLYPAYGAFLSARRFQTTTGIDKLIDSAEMGAGDVEPDHFFYKKALDLFARERGTSPLFMFVYTTANHFPWDTQYRTDLTPGWRPLNENKEVDEYIRRQAMSANDYQDLIARLKKDYPGEQFLVVRFGDHPPNIASRILEPALSNEDISKRIKAHDPRFFTTYYSIEGVNYRPADFSSARDGIDAAYLPLVIQQVAGLPLDASFREQKRIFDRCEGRFYGCRNGAEASRFNRLLIDAGLIKDM